MRGLFGKKGSKEIQLSSGLIKWGRMMHEQSDYLTIKELYDKGLELYFIRELKCVEIWCKADDIIHTKQRLKWEKTPVVEMYRIAVKCYSLHYGDFYLIMSEKTWKRAIRTAKDEDNKEWCIISKNNLYIHAILKQLNANKYKINVIEAFTNEQDYNAKLSIEKQRILW